MPASQPRSHEHFDELCSDHAQLMSAHSERISPCRTDFSEHAFWLYRNWFFMKKPAPVLPGDPGYELSLAGQLSARHVLQLFEARVGKRPSLFGNALLVRHLGRVFIISAGHVLNPTSHAERPLFYFTEPGKGLAKLGLRGIAFTQGTAEFDGKDVLDLAAGELISELPSPKLKEPLESSRIVSLGPSSSDDVYLATGFPTSRSKADPSSNRLTTILSAFRTTLAPRTARAALRTHPMLQLVLSLNIDRMNFPDGSVKAIADPAGMSGSPIWLQEGNELKCAGILIEHHRSKKLLVATDIAVGLHLMESAAALAPLSG